ncbi:MAG TPA: helix-turn-helix transcriptional regulator [Pseudonocardiaceae bacterium]|jgi:transcriptional regulator with XRE-family HTH domain/tetratricopeptide (TPR) repeat protein|nr:helix-turn-helix transcriptional regulator [Pseudonocardiaceae bacterium]
MDSHEREQFAAELRRLRDRAGLSLGELAGRAHVNRGYVGHIEHGQRWPSRSVASALDDALDARGSLLAAWTPADSAAPLATETPGSDGEALTLPLDQWTATDGDALAERLTIGSDRALTATAARRLVHEWLAAEAPQTVEITAGRRIGMGMVDTVARRVAQLRRVDDFIAGRELQPLVERELRAAARLLHDAAYTDQVGRALLSAIAELCQLVGWVTVDAGAPQRAVRYLALGIHAAHAAGDRPTAANLVSTLSYQVANLDDPHEAVLLARSATAGARGHASATTRALLYERVAWAHARAGELRHTERALSAVDTEYGRRRPDDDPEWVYWLDEDEITVMAGRCYVELGQPDRAIPLLTGVLERYDERQTRESALYTSWLAEAHVQAGDVEHAAVLAERTLELSSSTSSSRGDDRVMLLAQRLAAHRAMGAVRNFLAHAAERRAAG